MFCERSVVSQSDRSVARREAKAAVGFPFCGSCLFYVLHCCYSSYGLVFSRIFFLLQNIKSPASGLIALPFIFQGVILIPPQSRKKKEEVTFFRRERCGGVDDVEWTLGTASDSSLESNLSSTKVNMNSEGGSLAFQHSRGGKVQEEVGT